MQKKNIVLPKLNNLKPTIESTALKLMEEAGELAQAIGKLRGLSGETRRCSEQEAVLRITRELLDVAQTAVHDVCPGRKVWCRPGDGAQGHIQKLQKGYLKDLEHRIFPVG